MTADDLRDAREAVPFQPFTIRLPDGRFFRIHHRDYLSLSPDGRTAIVFKDAGGHHVLDLNLIHELEVEPLPADRTPAAG
jgi:hypothetical protein